MGEDAHKGTMIFLAKCSNTIFSFALLLKQFSLFLRGCTKHWFLTLRQVRLPDWDMLANEFYTPQLIHLDARIWIEDRNNEAAMMMVQTSGAMIDEPIFGVLHLQLFPHRCSLNLLQKEACITPFPEGYLLLIFVIYKNCLKHIRRFKHHCRIMTNNDAFF